MDKAKEFFKQYKKQIIAIVIILILIVLWNKYGYKIIRLFKPAQGNNAPMALSDVRKNQIENLMSEIHTDIHETDFWGGHHYDIYNQLLGMYDDEISYGADYYKNFLGGGKSLHYDLSDQYFLWSDVNNKVLDKLKELGKDK